MSENSDKLPINKWAEDDRPREKMINNGKTALSNAELIAILLGSGSRDESAVELSQRILHSVNNNLIELSKLSIKDLIRNFKGIGEAKAITIIAALELGNRRRNEEVIQKIKIASSKDAFEIFYSVLSSSQYEEFWILLINRANQVISKVCISEGGISGTVADPKRIFKLALDYQASSIILCHNHPSGNIKPSQADIELTRKLVESGDLLEIKVLDHIICGDEVYYSFADEGLI